MGVGQAAKGGRRTTRGLIRFFFFLVRRVFSGQGDWATGSLHHKSLPTETKVYGHAFPLDWQGIFSAKVDFFPFNFGKKLGGAGELNDTGGGGTVPGGSARGEAGGKKKKKEKKRKGKALPGRLGGGVDQHFNFLRPAQPAPIGAGVLGGGEILR